jgi:hypothetical protein
MRKARRRVEGKEEVRELQKPTHNTEDCWSKDSNKRAKYETKTGGKGGKETSHVTFTKDQFQKLVKGIRSTQKGSDKEDSFLTKLLSGNDSECKCNVTSQAITAMYTHCVHCTAHTYQCYVIQEGNELKRKISSESSDHKRKCSDNIDTENAFPLEPRDKRRKFDHFTPEVVLELENNEGQIVPIRALLDTGTSSTIILKEHMRKGFVSHHKGHDTVWKTLGGTFKTKRKGLLEFKFPELTNNQTITWVAHVDDANKAKDTMYDMIIGMDLMITIGIHVDTAQKMVIWRDHSTPLKQRGTMQDSSVMEAM